VAREPVILEPHAGVGVAVVPGHVGRISETRGGPRILDARAKGSWTPLVWRPATVTVIVPVVASSTTPVVVVARAVVTMIVNAPDPLAGLNGVSLLTSWPEPTLDC
jgi:hypothetical protein